MAGRLMIVFMPDEKSVLPGHVFDMDLTPHDTQNVADAFRGISGMIIPGEILSTIANAIRIISELHWHKEIPRPIVVADLTQEPEEDGFVHDLTGDPAPGEPGSIENPLPVEALETAQVEEAPQEEGPIEEAPQEEPDAEAKPKTRRKRKTADPL
jgi:hypothetical protein